MNPTHNQVNELIREWDGKYRRVVHGDFLNVESLRAGEIADRLRDLATKRPVGKYELVCIDIPELDDLAIPGLSDSDDDKAVDAAYAEFDRLMGELAPDVDWVIPREDPRYDPDNVAILFSDLPTQEF